MNESRRKGTLRFAVHRIGQEEVPSSTKALRKPSSGMKKWDILEWLPCTTGSVSSAMRAKGAHKRCQRLCSGEVECGGIGPLHGFIG